MRARLLLTGLAAVSLLAAGLTAAASSAYATSDTAGVSSGSANQYLQFCSSASTCNEQQNNNLYVQFTRTGSTSGALNIFYKIVNGTAVNGTDFNTPATGEVTIPAGQTVYPDFAIPLVNEHQYGTSKSFSIVITSTTPSVTLSPGTGTETILGGNVPLDCAFTWISGTAQSMTCTARPATQVWRIQGECKSNMGGFFIPEPGDDVTGNGTSSVSAPCTLFATFFNLVTS